jgi:hypothetical protein
MEPKWTISTKNTILCLINHRNVGFQENRQFFEEIGQKSQKKCEYNIDPPDRISLKNRAKN